MTRPVGFGAGGLGLVLAWLGGVAIVQLTGATPVLIVLSAGLVLFVASAFDGLWSVRRARFETIELPHSSTVGESVAITGVLAAPHPLWVDVRHNGATVAEGWTEPDRFVGEAEFVHRGVVEELDVVARSGGRIGLIWWQRSFSVPTDRHLVAPPAISAPLPIDRCRAESDGDLAGAAGAVSGEIDGVRPWRDGDSEKFVHWSSSLRAGELMVHDRRRAADVDLTVRARSGTDDPEAEAGAARFALEQGLRDGANVSVAIDDHPPVAIDDHEAAAEWAALAPLGDPPGPSRSWRQIFRRTEPEATSAPDARWWAAAATVLSLWMLTGALGYSLATNAAIGFGAALGAWVSARSLASGEPPSLFVRAAVGLGALGGFAMVIAGTGRLDGILATLRGPLPQVLVILILLHGFECRDRRTLRVSLAISGVVIMYASGLRVDGSIAWWLAAWALCFGVAMAKIAGPTHVTAAPVFRLNGPASVPAGVLGRRLAGTGVGLAATVAVLVVVPVPSGPARLTLPTLIENAEPVGSAGAIVGPDGEVRDTETGDDGGSIDRAPAGQAGGYTGFAQSMDTSVRGDLSDQIVMRVRAPEPDFWRGQTFSLFDGRRWHADPDVGTPRRGPDIAVPPSLGDIPIADDIEVEEFVQTYFLEADMPNVIFHAGRPNRIIAETDVWTRPDGALRATSTLPDESIYTVVSERVVVGPELLARQGHIANRLTELGRNVFARQLEVPATTSPETIALANELAAGASSTYEVVRAYEAWMNENVEYDLDAPLPDPGEDAVHDFLFDSQLGFCEQIASSLTIMLRTQGVPARLATGYVSGTRDQVAGVFEVRASDAHAWVEVWFPETGWQAFDPTASVPLSADAKIESVGADLASGVSGYVSENSLELVAIGGLAFAGFGAWQVSALLIARRRRGRWGTLQDRFATLARRRDPDLAVSASNPALAAAWAMTDEEVRSAAQLVAARLDRSAFDPSFDDTDTEFDDTKKLVTSLRGSDR